MKVGASVGSSNLAVSGPNTRAGDLSSWTIVVARKIAVSGTATLTINSDYVSGSVPVPQGVGPKAGAVTRLEN